MYFVDSKGRYASYVSGVTFSENTQKNWASRNDENRRISTTASQDAYFKKQQLIQEAIKQLQQNGVVSEDIAKEIDVESLKKSLEHNSSGESEASSIAESIAGYFGDNQEVSKNNLSNAKNFALEAKLKNEFAILEESKTRKIQEAKKQIQQSTHNQEQKNETIGTFFEKSFLTTNALKPQNISQDVLKAYNPLEAKGEEIPQNAVGFVDEVSGKTIHIPLNEENMKRLNEKFGSLQKASDYVKGWYYDAAYKVGYLSGDSNGDGNISVDEGIHLKSLVSLIDSQYYSIAQSIPAGEEQQKKFLEQVGFIDNLADFINHSIAQDANLDGDLNLKEVMRNDNEIMLFATKNLQTLEITDIFVIKHFNFSSGGFSFDDFLLNLLGSNQSNTDTNGKKDIGLESIKPDEVGVWINSVKKSNDKRFLDSLSNEERGKLLKTDVILGNLLKSS
ncbi:hypothetical protein [Helicobacter mesocricetorum]|uniref:hypothetical protein n=1 Tax=Helicobacter mesocricetorum TaxID=87012 RepID=UPI000CF085D1|nr:hypothetical protein [Helicobacter mesocricetorum]